MLVRLFDVLPLFSADRQHSPANRENHRMAVWRLSKSLGYAASQADLTDDCIAWMQQIDASLGHPASYLRRQAIMLRSMRKWIIQNPSAVSAVQGQVELPRPLRSTAHQGQGDRSGASRRKATCHRVFSIFSAFLRRRPLPADCTGAHLADFSAWHERLFPFDPPIPTDYQVWSRVARIAGRRRSGRGRPTRQLSEAPNTLWGICLLEYFPRNLRIQSDKTKKQYRIALADWKETIGRDPVPSDLQDDDVLTLMNAMRARGLSVKCVNERASRIKALWNWLAKRRRAEFFPTFQRMKMPRRVPEAWTKEELTQLFATCASLPGELVPGIRNADFWTALHWFLWDVGERISATLACRWDWLNQKTGYIEIPAEVRKGQDADLVRQLRPQTLAALRQIRKADGDGRIFPWPLNETMIYKRYKRILKSAGLPSGRRDMFHRLRKSHASHLEAAGGNASSSLGHAGRAVTDTFYIDPRITSPGPASMKLFDPLEGFALPAPPAEPLRLEYRDDRRRIRLGDDLGWVLIQLVDRDGEIDPAEALEMVKQPESLRQLAHAIARCLKDDGEEEFADLITALESGDLDPDLVAAVEGLGGVREAWSDADQVATPQ